MLACARLAEMKIWFCRFPAPPTGVHAQNHVAPIWRDFRIIRVSAAYGRKPCLLMAEQPVFHIGAQGGQMFPRKQVFGLFLWPSPRPNCGF
jgi:hypothetical protein